jgi:hypothetical protein
LIIEGKKCTAHLTKEANDPDHDKNGIFSYASKYVSLVVNLPCVYLVEQGHENEDVEHDGEVNARL